MQIGKGGNDADSAADSPCSLRQRGLHQARPVAGADRQALGRVDLGADDVAIGLVRRDVVALGGDPRSRHVHARAGAREDEVGREAEEADAEAVARIAARLPGCIVEPTDVHGLDADFVEAMAFASSSTSGPAPRLSTTTIAR